ncbi:MAG: 2-C-methyl-D-erythritol 2,4-cyclodiphosphate synthase [Acidimicrobiales bacterium]
MTVRVGQGFDVHPFAGDPDRRLVLGGVPIDGGRGLAGHSDADAVAHALADALLGAAGLGDLGHHFPDSDPAWAGADSIDLLGAVAAMVLAAGFRPVNADCTVVAEAPKLAPFVERMVARLSATVGAPVSVKATRAEGLGALGRVEGIACLAVVLVEVVESPVRTGGGERGHETPAGRDRP